MSVDDWATDYDIFDPAYVDDPVPIWRELRSTCPVAHSDRWGGSYLPTRYDDVRALSKMVPALSSADMLVVPPPREMLEHPKYEKYGANSPPITADPPEHTWTRQLLLPHFSPASVETYRTGTEELCHRLIDGFIGTGRVDAAGGYAQQIPPRVIAHLIGIDEDRVDEFTSWVRGVLEYGLEQPKLRVEYGKKIRKFFWALVNDLLETPDGSFISGLLVSEGPDGRPVDPQIVVGMLNLLLIAGIDTTWSSLGAALWHLATHPDDRERLADDPGLFPSAIEELLRAYSPVTMARVATEPVSIAGIDVQPGERVLMNFPGANHDPDVFDQPDEVILDRLENPHIAFGAGIHRCVGSHLARMELDTALRIWFDRIPDFHLADAAPVTWAGGQVRGPRYVPVEFPT